MSDCLWERTLAGLWTDVKADAGIVTAAGQTPHWFEFLDRSLLMALEYNPAHCPFINISPATSGSIRKPARRRRGPDVQDTFAVLVDMATAGQYRAKILNLEAAFWACIVAGIKDGFGLGAEGPDEAFYSEMSFTAHPDQNKLIESWSFSTTLSLRYRSDA